MTAFFPKYVQSGRNPRRWAKFGQIWYRKMGNIGQVIHIFYAYFRPRNVLMNLVLPTAWPKRMVLPPAKQSLKITEWGHFKDSKWSRHKSRLFEVPETFLALLNGTSDSEGHFQGQKSRGLFLHCPATFSAQFHW